MNRHVLWTIPLSNLVLFTTVGLALAVIVRLTPGRRRRLATGALTMLWILTLLLSFRRIHPLACVVLASGLSWRLAVRIETKITAFRQIVRFSLPALVVIMVGLIGTSLGRERLREYRDLLSLPRAASNGPTAPNVLLIVLDTVRADRLSLYGYGRDTTPNLARLARRGVLFRKARSTASWTLPSHASMMTGRWPHQTSARLHGPLDTTHTTIAAFLSAYGYSTAGFVANTTYCGAETGLGYGFVHYEDHDSRRLGILRTSALGSGFPLADHRCVQTAGWAGGRPFEPRKDAARINHDFLAWIEGRGDRPFFAFLNYFDAHTPYLTPASFDRHFGIKPEKPADLVTLDRWFTLDKKHCPPRDHQLASDAYDDCLAYLDSQIGMLFDRASNGVACSRIRWFSSPPTMARASESTGCSATRAAFTIPRCTFPLHRDPSGNRHAGESVDVPVSLRDLPATITGLIGLGKTSPFPGTVARPLLGRPKSPRRRASLGGDRRPSQEVRRTSAIPRPSGVRSAARIGQ